MEISVHKRGSAFSAWNSQYSTPSSCTPGRHTNAHAGFLEQKIEPARCYRVSVDVLDAPGEHIATEHTVKND
jgi:hypothetical protein